MSGGGRGPTSFGGESIQNEDKWDPLGQVKSFFEGVEGVSQQDVCEGLHHDIAEVGKRAAIHKDAAQVLEAGNEPQAASDLRSVAMDEKQVAEDLITIAEDVGCQVPTELKNAVDSL